MNVAAPFNSRACLLAIALVALTTMELFLTGCRGDLDPERPDGSYLIFRDALFDGDGDGIWERTDDRTRTYFEDHYKRLQDMNDLIERYLPSTDHQLARRQSGVELLEEIDSGKALFLHILEPTEFADDDAVFFGSNPDEIRISEEGDSAIIATHGGQEFVLTRQDDEQWYVNLADSGSFLDEAFEWLSKNQDALEQTVEDLIAEERQVREQIIADLMGLDDD